MPPNLDQYFSINMFEYHSLFKRNYSVGEYPREEKFIPIPHKKCPPERFQGMSQDAAGDWRCADNINFTLARGLDVKMILINLGYCNNFTLQMYHPNLTCKSREETDAILPFVAYVLTTLEQYFDVSDFENPIKYNLKAYQYFPSFDFKQAWFNIAENRAIMKDSSFYSSYDAKNQTYVSIVEAYKDNGILVNDFYQMLFIIDENLHTTTRVVYNLVDALTDTGGLASVITFVFTVLTLRI